MSAIFISHSSRDDEAARAIRGRRSQVLAGEPHFHQILLDEEGIRAGNLWRPKLYRWLAECAGAVLLLTEQALTSDWVRKEATILLWRHALGSRVVVIPLLVGVSQQDVETAFPAIEIFERQYLRISEPADAETAIGKITKEFSQVADPEDQLGSWAKRLYSLAAFLARNLGWRYYEHVVSSRTTAQDLLWSFDSMRRLADASAPGRASGPDGLDNAGYTEPGVMWWALDRKSALRRGRAQGPGAGEHGDDVAAEPFGTLNAAGPQPGDGPLRAGRHRGGPAGPVGGGA